MSERDDGHESDADEDETVLARAQRRSLESIMLRRSRADAQLVLERVLDAFSGLSETAFRLVRMNALVLTILVATAAQVRTVRYLNTLTVASVVLFVASVVFALVGYTTRRVDLGIGPGAFEKAVAYRLREDEYLQWILTKGYGRWIERAVEKGNRRERWVRYSLTAFLAGITTLVAGTVMSLY